MVTFQGTTPLSTAPFTTDEVAVMPPDGGGVGIGEGVGAGDGVGFGVGLGGGDGWGDGEEPQECVKASCHDFMALKSVENAPPS
mgnify:CR=1 FL=1